MKGIKNIEGELSCLIEDALFFNDGSYMEIVGDSKSGYKILNRQNILPIIDNGWSSLYPVIESQNNKYKVIAGETSWGGTGFVALQDIQTAEYVWILHLSTLNNPEIVKISTNTIRMRTDQNNPNGIDFIIPIDNPEKFKIENPADNIM